LARLLLSRPFASSHCEILLLLGHRRTVRLPVEESFQQFLKRLFFPIYETEGISDHLSASIDNVSGRNCRNLVNGLIFAIHYKG
jgi:hypothetical protein